MMTQVRGYRIQSSDFNAPNLPHELFPLFHGSALNDLNAPNALNDLNRKNYSLFTQPTGFVISHELCRLNILEEL